jgi:hypothetical protein
VNHQFEQLIAPLDDRLQQLTAMAPVKVTALPRTMPSSGVYLFSEDGRHLYVGRSDRLRKRLQQHSRPSSPHGTAPFAFRLARAKTGQTEAAYSAKGSRAYLERDPTFARAFLECKQRVRKMNIQFVEERDPLRQTLLEIYVAVALETPYNDFANH